MWAIGVDTHRQLLSAVVVDTQGREQRHWQGPNQASAWLELHGWVAAQCTDGPRQWGIEGTGHQGFGLAQQLVGCGECVFEVNPRLTAALRARSRRLAKSDHDDARAIARLLLQEDAQLPRVQPVDATSPLAILTRERHTLRSDLVRERNRLHAELVRIEPPYAQRVGKLTTRTGLEAVLAWDEAALDALARLQLQTAQRRARRLLVLQDDLAAVDAQIRAHSRQQCAPLTAIYGVAELTAGMLAGYLGPGDRFATDAQLAQHAGVAPVETGSAGRIRHRLNRSGHRKLNELIHRIALTQARGYGPARTYLARRQTDGKSWREAIRALMRHIVRTIWRVWKQCLAGTAPLPAAAATA